MPDRATLENRAVEAYLQYVATGVIPGDPKDETAIEVLDERIANEPQLHRKVILIAERHRLANPPPPDPKPLIDKFIYYAPSFGERNNITYAVWREMGVPPKVLKDAGIAMTSAPVRRATAGNPKMAPDDPRRKRAYRPRKNWTPEDRAEFAAYYDEHGVAETAIKFGYNPNYVATLMRAFQQGLSSPKGMQSQKH